MTWIMSHLPLVISLLGGTAAIVTAAKASIKPIVKWGIAKAVSDPKWAHVLLEYRIDIEGFFDDVDSGVKEGLDAAAAKQTPTK